MATRFVAEREPLLVGVYDWEWDGDDRKRVSIFTEPQAIPLMQQLPGQEVVFDMDTIYSVTLDAGGKTGIINNVQTVASAGLRRGMNVKDIGTVLNVDYSYRHPVIFEPPISPDILNGSLEQSPTKRERVMKILPL